jgi:hypothetical protein
MQEMHAEVFILLFRLINLEKNNNRGLGRQDIGLVFQKKKEKERSVGK